jgi:DNA-binding MarR family transcriptional regulator
MADERFVRSRSAGYLANHMARLFARRLQERIGPLGLAPAQFMALLELWREEGLTQRDLVRRLDVEQATMANTLARMERDGLIERRAGEGDARLRTIHLADRARGLRGPAEAAAREVNAMALADLGGAGGERFLAAMATVVDALKRD